MLNNQSSNGKSIPMQTITGLPAEQNQIKYVLAVMSGKGGVGKSFVSALIATGLAKEGYKVGILDADITGASIPTLFGLRGPVGTGRHSIEPLFTKTGIKVISMNLLIPNQEQPVVWQGAMIGRAVTQLWEDVLWGPLDCLVVDLPTGTSDAVITAVQSIPIDGALMVTSPQWLSSLIVKKAVHMVQDSGLSILGIIENMSFFRSPESGKEHKIFGESQADEVATTAQAPILAKIPLDPDIAEKCDSGNIEEVHLPELDDFFNKLCSIIPLSSIHSFTSDSAGSLTENSNIFTKESLESRASLSSQSPTQQVRSFSERALRLIKARENMGAFEKPDARGYFRGRCGDNMQIDFLLSDEKITEARFLTDGCGATIACGSMVTNLAQSKTLTEALKITPKQVLDELESLPENHDHCAELAVMTLRETIIDAIEGHGTPKQ